MFVDLINNWDEATTLSKELRAGLYKKFPIESLEFLSLLESKNKDSVKAILKLKDENIIETVLMRHLRPARTPSLQSGDLAGQDDVKRGKKHRLRFFASRLRHELRFLRHGENGAEKKFDWRRNR